MTIIKRLDVIGLLSFCSYLYLAIISHTMVSQKLPHFLGVNVLTWLLLFSLFFILKNSNTNELQGNNSKLIENFHQTVSCQRKLASRLFSGILDASVAGTTQCHKRSQLIYRIFIWGFLFQLPGLFCDPLLDDDYFRYLWDGYVFATTGNPYVTIPASYFSVGLPADMEMILNRINYPDIPTIYGSLCQYLFLIANYFRPHQVFVLKALLLCANTMSALMMLRLTRPSYFLLFAWCPLLIIQSVYELHMDAFGMFLLIVAIYLYATTNPKASIDQSKHMIAMIFSGLAIATKILAAPIVFMMLIRYRLKYWFLLLATIAFMYAPLSLMTQLHNPHEINMFFSNWIFNSSAYELFQYFIGPIAGRLLSLFLFASLIAYLCIDQQKGIKRIPRGDIILGVLFLLSPVMNPWYLVWLLPFAAIYPARWSWIALMAVNLSYINGYYMVSEHLAPYQIPLIIQVIEYGAVFLAALIDASKKPVAKVTCETVY